MSSFISRFNSKKRAPPTAESQPAANSGNSRNFNSVGPIKANTAAIQNQQRGSQSRPAPTQPNASMYVITTELDFSNAKKSKGGASSAQEQALQRDVDQLREQVKDLETNLHINKGIIKNLMDQQNPANINQTLQQVLQSLQKENSNLQEIVSRTLQQRNEAQQKLQALLQEEESKPKVGNARSSSKDPHSIPGQNLDKQMAELKTQYLAKESAYNEVLQFCSTQMKSDKAFMQKLRELKFKHAAESGGKSTLATSGNQMTINTQSYTMADDNPENSGPVSLAQENERLKRELDFATGEIDRLRAKLIIDDDEMPPLSDELFGSLNSKERQVKGIAGVGGLGDLSMDNSDRNSEFISLKEAISQTNTQNPINSQSRNGARNASTTQSSSFIGKPVPKLDFKRLKKVQEFRDWYAYASKLEDSVKYLRDRMRQLEEDQTQLNQKYRKEQAQKENLFQMNEKLNKALKRANVKIQEVKEKYKDKMLSKRCHHCQNDVEMTIGLSTTFDQVQVTEMNSSFMVPGQSSGPVIDDEDEKHGSMRDDIEGKVGAEMFENLEIDDNNAQMESDKLRQQQNHQKKMISRGVLKLNQIKREQDPTVVQSKKIISSQMHVSNVVGGAGAVQYQQQQLSSKRAQKAVNQDKVLSSIIDKQL